jgi:hypothetical protein
MLGDISMAAKHVLGAVHIIKNAGGPGQLGLGEFVYFILWACVHGKRLLDWQPVIRCGTDFMKAKKSSEELATSSLDVCR